MKHWLLFAIINHYCDISSTSGFSIANSGKNENLLQTKEGNSIKVLDRQELAPSNTTSVVTEEDEVAAAEFMRKLNEESALKSRNVSLLSWAYSTNITKHNKEVLLKAKEEYGEYAKDRWNRVQIWKTKWPHFKNENLKRQFKSYSNLGTAALPKDKYDELTSILTEMAEIYSTSKICAYNKPKVCDLSLEPEIKEIMKSSRDYNELGFVWLRWRENFKQNIKDLYIRFVELSNEAALLNGFPTTAEMWTDDYESETFEVDIAQIYEQLSPLYKELHAYTRRKLREIYGEDKIQKRGPIPAHLTGNMWAQSWTNLYDILVPYPNKTDLDVTAKMLEQNYTARLMFEKADEFFTSLGLEKVPQSFWNHSMIEKPKDREVVCHASAWDFTNGQDVRIKQCTSVDMDDFFTVHHELGHIQYFMLYKNQPLVFQSGANPGFHEAVGDLMSLSVSTPKHLHKVGLLNTYEPDEESDLNFLLKTALDAVAFLPFAYLVDKYRWDVMRGNIVPDNYTRSWWDLRYELQGVTTPFLRMENDFDPAAKFHVSGNVRYIRYFVSKILQFQFHKSVCEIANEYDPNDPNKPLHQCDIYQSKEAGAALRKMLETGSSVHWSESLKSLTGTTKMDASALREYFRPLEIWLKKNNEEYNEFVGWEGDHPVVILKRIPGENFYDPILNGTYSIEIKENTAHQFVRISSEMQEYFANRYMNISWAYQTNITATNKDNLIKVKNDYGDFKKYIWKNFQDWKSVWPQFKDETLKRQFKINSVLGLAALTTEKYQQLTNITTEMSEKYATGKICDYKNRTNCNLSLDPDIKEILKSSKDYDELAYVWKAWRDNVGAPVRNLYQQFVMLANEAAEINGFPSNAEMWMTDYETENLEKLVDELYSELKPLYEQLHAYTRRKLREFYGEEKISRRGPIPAHLTGNMWAQSWNDIYDLLEPYPSKTSFDVTDAMKEQEYTPKLMFEKSDDFFASLGLERAPSSFWNNSMIVKPDDRKVNCHASAWDFSYGKDFRIKQCTQVNMNDFFTVHHEMGHIQYYLQYCHLPIVFRRGANPGFHEALGDVLSLSVSTPKHLKKINLLKEFERDNETEINFLLNKALSDIAFLPFGYLIDKYRWGIFQGKITPNNYTKAWWNLRQDIQGVSAPFVRTEEDFDPAAKSHVSSNTRYIRYFVARILTFQFHKALCVVANEYNSTDPDMPLHNCDIHGSKEAGQKLSDMMKLGRSKHWSEALKSITGSTTIDVSALREYYRPLEQWLIASNKEQGEFIGWE